jgi:hypothetical protein
MTDTTPSIRDQAEALLTRIRTTGTDEEPFDVNRFVHCLLGHYRKIAAGIWAIEDVQGVRPDLTADQAWQVLEEAGDKHDAEYGICWTTLECVAQNLFGDAPETDAAEEKQP